MKNAATVVTLSLSVFLLSAHHSHAQPIKGVSLLPGGATDLFTPGSDQAISSIARLNANTIAIPVFWFQDDLTSSVIEQNTFLYSPTMSSLEHAITEAQSQNLNVVILPMVDVRTGQWRANINPRSGSAWWNNYSDYIVTMAELAQDTGVAKLSLGTGLTSAEASTAQWQNLITQVSNVYDGDVTYVVDHTSLFDRQIPWLKQLDEVWIDAYFSLSDSLNPTLPELTNAWQNIAGSVANWYDDNQLNQPLVFINGYRSRIGSASEPWDSWAQAPVDLKVQSDAITAELSSLWSEKYFGGYVNWHTSTNPNIGGPKDTGYTVKNKPAQDVLNEWFTDILPGDATKDGTFNQFDIIQVLQAGKYLTGQNATWGEGDWNGAPGGNKFFPPSGDGVFDQLDLVAALQAGIYNTGSYRAISPIMAVPEPSGIFLVISGLLLFVLSRYCR